ncbi:MAG: hypothetical protein QM704_22005 [Anaeromyxobacteraceae bacterium]
MEQPNPAAGPGITPGPGRPAYAGHDLDPSRRPGVPKERRPEPLVNARPHPARQSGTPSVPRHGRPGKPMPPVFGTAVPLRGLSGLLRRAAYRHPDHAMRHWTMLLLADRVDSWERRSWKVVRVVAPAALAIVALRWLSSRE